MDQEEQILDDGEGNSITSKQIGILDQISFLGMWIPLTLLLSLATVDKHASVWSAFVLTFLFLSNDYLRSRFRRNHPRIRIFPSTFLTFNMLAFLVDGIIVETLPNFNVILLGPIACTLIWFGISLTTLLAKKSPVPLHHS
jgi:hypothetical protein